jgi:hypothetical protein
MQSVEYKFEVLRYFDSDRKRKGERGMQGIITDDGPGT